MGSYMLERPAHVTQTTWDALIATTPPTENKAPENGTPAQVVHMVPELPTLMAVIEAVRQYMDVTPEEAVYIAVALAVGVATAMHDEDPLWLLLVAASGSGKTAAIRLLRHVADKQVDELTRAGLLSWTTGGKKAKRTGLLTEIPPVALVTISDFSTVVTMGDHEARARMFGMLRVVYDGRIYRSLGGQSAAGADPLEWEGHLTILGGATTAIDTHLSFEATLGERWLLFRLPETTGSRARQRTAFSIGRAHADELRQHAQALAARLVEQARTRIPAQLTQATKDALTDAALFAAHARTGVQFEGSGKYRIPVGYPMPEEPMRLAGQLYRLARCLVALGMNEQQASAISIKAACDSVPLARLRALHEIATTEMATVASVHRAIGRGNRWGAKWELAALEAIGMVDVNGPSEDDDPKATRTYQLKPDYREVYETVGSLSIALSIEGQESHSRSGGPTDSHTPTGTSHPDANPAHTNPADNRLNATRA